MKQFIDCRYIAIKQFKIEKGYQPKNSLLFIVRGEIEFFIQGSKERAGNNTLISFPDNVYFERKMLAPSELYYVRYENTENELLPIGKISIENSGRLVSTLKYLLQLNNVNGQQALKNGFLADIFHQIHADTLITNMISDRIVTLVSDLFEKNLHKQITLSETAYAVGLSVSGLICHFKKHTGMTPIKYLTMMRLQRAEALLCQTNNSIAHIASVCGFDNPYYFSNTFKKYHGISPTAYRQRHSI